MQVGFFTMPTHPVGRDRRETLAEDREAFLLADMVLPKVNSAIGEQI